MTSESFNQVVAELRTYGGVAVLGAGVSYLSGYPLERELHALVWHAIDPDAAALEAVAMDLGVEPRRAKELIGDSRKAADAAFKAIKSSGVARRAFQHGFAALDRQRRVNPGPAHDAIARLLHSGVFEHVISFNWDTATQFAHERRYGRFPVAGMDEFYKPHGDADQPDSSWVLPHEAGGISTALRGQLNTMADERPRVLLVIGYAERDQGVVRDLITPLAQRWRVVRIGPGVAGELDLNGNADDVLPELADALVASPEVAGWEFVGFGNQRGIGAALAGFELGARDVEACPALLEVDQLRQVLSVANCAVLVGESGSGKSLAAYQSAFASHNDGWEVVRRSRAETPEVAVDSLDRIRHRTVAIVDDAQVLAEPVTTRLLERGNASLKVIVVSADTMGGPRASLTIARGRAVATIAASLRVQRDLVLPLVQELDDRVGDGYFQESLERRIAEAAKSDGPWQFNFVLTGGERRAHQHMAELRDVRRFDLAMAGLAAGQLLTLDRGVARPWLDALAASVGESEGWTSEALSALRGRKLLLEEETLRLPHLRYAAVALRELGDRHRDPRLRGFAAALWAGLADEDLPLQGISWLLSELRMSIAFRRPDEKFVDHDAVRSLLSRCWNTGPLARDRAIACFVVDSILQLSQLAETSILDNVATLSSWLNEAERPAARGLAQLLNSVANKDRDLAELICLGANPTQLARRISDSNLDDVGAWGYLVGRLALASSAPWMAAFLNGLDVGKLSSTVGALDFQHLTDFAEIVKGMWSVSIDSTLDLIEAAIDPLAALLNGSPAEATARTNEVIWFGLGYAPGFLRHSGPNKRQVELASLLTTRLHASAIAAAISSGTVRTWHQLEPLLAMISEMAPDLIIAVADAIDLESFESATAGMWAKPPEELLFILHVVAESSEMSGGRSLVQRHVGELEELDPILARLNPQATCEALDRGCGMQLRRDSDESWPSATTALREIAAVSKDRAARVLRSNMDAIRHGFLLSSDEASVGLEEFLHVADEVVPGLVDQLLLEMKEGAMDTWSENLAAGHLRRSATEALTARLPPIRES